MQDNATPLSPASFMTRIAAMIYELLLVTAVVFVASFIIAPVVGELACALATASVSGLHPERAVHLLQHILATQRTNTGNENLAYPPGSAKWRSPDLEAGGVSLCTCLDWNSARRRWALVGTHRP